MLAADIENLRSFNVFKSSEWLANIQREPCNRHSTLRTKSKLICQAAGLCYVRGICEDKIVTDSLIVIKFKLSEPL